MVAESYIIRESSLQKFPTQRLRRALADQKLEVEVTLASSNPNAVDKLKALWTKYKSDTSQLLASLTTALQTIPGLGAVTVATSLDPPTLSPTPTPTIPTTDPTGAPTDTVPSLASTKALTRDPNQNCVTMVVEVSGDVAMTKYNGVYYQEDSTKDEWVAKYTLMHEEYTIKTREADGTVITRSIIKSLDDVHHKGVVKLDIMGRWIIDVSAGDPPVRFESNVLDVTGRPPIGKQLWTQHY